jgi:hypothetical protein
MKKLLVPLLALGLALGFTGAALAADELPHTGRVVFVAGGDIEVAADEQADVVMVINGDARVAGTVNTLVVVDGTASIAGGTLETLAIVKGTAELDADTTILGDVMHFDATVTGADIADVQGSVNDMAGDLAAFGAFLAISAIVLWIGVGIATLLFGLLVAGLAARQVRAATALISREPVLTGVVGLLSLVVVPVVAVLAMITVIGAPTGLALLFIVWPAVAFIGYVVAAIWLGEWLLNRRAGAVPADRPYAATAVGLVVAFVIGFVPLVTPIMSIFGFGAVILAAWRTLVRRGVGSEGSTPQAALAT